MQISNILYLKEKFINPSMNLVNEENQIARNRLLTKFNLTVKMDAASNKFKDGTTTNFISKLTVEGAKTLAMWKPVESSQSENYYIKAITPWNKSNGYIVSDENIKQFEGKYECIIIPQTVAANSFSVNLTFGDRDFSWVSPEVVHLDFNTQYNLTLVVGSNAVTVEDFTASPWTVEDVQV